VPRLSGGTEEQTIASRHLAAAVRPRTGRVHLNVLRPRSVLPRGRSPDRAQAVSPARSPGSRRRRATPCSSHPGDYCALTAGRLPATSGNTDIFRGSYGDPS
jgi:hypothetical protein